MVNYCEIPLRVMLLYIVFYLGEIVENFEKFRVRF